MNYIPLAKLRYKNKDGYARIFEQRSNGEDTIHLNVMIHGSPAFVYPCAEMYELMLNIEHLNARVIGCRLNLPKAAFQDYMRKCLIDEIYLTNDIEGVNSTRREIAEVLDQIEEKHGPKRFHGLIEKYLVLQSRDDIPLKTCQDVRTLYDELVLQEVLEEDEHDLPDGEYFRKGSVSVTSAAQKELHQGLYPEAKIIETMQSALNFVNDDSVNPYIRVAAFHYLFGYIHPFYNGNGRFSRFISSCMLSKRLDPLIGYRLSNTVRENLSKYYRAFRICNEPENRGDLTPFVILFLEMVAEAMESLAEELENRAAHYEEYKKIIVSTPIFKDKKTELNLAGLLMQAELFSENGISTGELKRYLSISSSSTLKNHLDVLRAYDLVKEQKVGKEKFYTIDPMALEKLPVAEE